MKFAIGFALWDRIAAERRITLELELYGFFVTAKTSRSNLYLEPNAARRVPEQPKP